jgi:SAM-dependent methyltransferase
VTSRLPDSYFDRLYDDADDPWQLSTRWYERRKYAITLAMLPNQRYRNAFEPGCSIGTLTALLAGRCDHVTAVDVAEAALHTADRRLTEAGCRQRVDLSRGSLEEAWPAGVDLVVLSEIGYYLDADALAAVLGRECPRLLPGATVVAAHWRHHVAEYPLTGDEANGIIGRAPGLLPLGRYRDEDVVVEVFDAGDPRSVATRENVPGA